jgi:hypothetical protein
LTTALLALVGGLFLAWHHPLWRTAAVAVFAAGVVVSAQGRGTWLVVLPAAWPLLNFSPWTGWLTFDESDLLILGVLAGGFVRLSFERADPRPASGRRPSGSGRRGGRLVMAFAGLGVFALLRGLVDAGGWSFGWFDGYADASNSLRLSKSLAYAAALWPLLRAELRRSPPQILQRFAHGMQIGLACVGVVLLWERTAYPGLLDFSARYRTTAAFWEMHVGGATIDAYLALAAPFAAWALVSARSRRGWVAAAILALLTGHACLTTFSRGAYVGAALPLFLLATWMVAAPTPFVATRRAPGGGRIGCVRGGRGGNPDDRLSHLGIWRHRACAVCPLGADLDTEMAREGAAMAPGSCPGSEFGADRRGCGGDRRRHLHPLPARGKRKRLQFPSRALAGRSRLAEEPSRLVLRTRRWAPALPLRQRG